MMPGSKAPGLSDALARVYEVGPIIWIKGTARRQRALEGADRRELVDQVPQLLPQANEGNAVFSLYREQSASGGSQFTVLSRTYYSLVVEDKEMKFSKMIRTFVSGSLFFLLLAGCAGSSQSSTAPTGSQPASDRIEADQSQPTWETQVYEDTYLSYEIPADWQKHENSSDELLLTLFTPQEAATATPSNVSVQILSLQNQSKNFDYADPEIQKAYYEFLTSPGSGLPTEMQDKEYWTEQINGTWVYCITFARDAEDGTMVQQTGYFPMGLDYSLAIWATDYQDGCNPPVEEIAEHICETLQILEP